MLTTLLLVLLTEGNAWRERLCLTIEGCYQLWTSKIKKMVNLQSSPLLPERCLLCSFSAISPFRSRLFDRSRRQRFVGGCSGCAPPTVACNWRRNHPIAFLVTQFVLNSIHVHIHSTLLVSRKLDSHIISSKGSAEHLLGHFSYRLPGISHPRIQIGGVALGNELLKHFFPSLCIGAVLS